MVMRVIRMMRGMRVKRVMMIMNVERSMMTLRVTLGVTKVIKLMRTLFLVQQEEERRERT